MNSSGHSQNAESTAELGLSWWAFVINLTIVLAIFAGLNPIWERPDAIAWKQNILWSYAPIPLLVLLFCVIEKKLDVVTVLLESLKLGLTKFSITFLAAHVIWMTYGHPSVAGKAIATVAPSAHVSAGFAPRPLPQVSAIDAAQTASLKGRVLDAHGNPVADAVVYIAGGLEEYVFAPPSPEATIAVDQVASQPVIVHAYQTLRITAGESGLHTVRLLNDEGRILFNRPVLQNAGQVLMFDRHYGLVHMSCTVHTTEAPVDILVLANPFVGRTGEDGAFELSGVPVAQKQLRIVARHGAKTAAADTRLPAGQGQAVELTLGD